MLSIEQKVSLLRKYLPRKAVNQVAKSHSVTRMTVNRHINSFDTSSPILQDLIFRAKKNGLSMVEADKATTELAQLTDEDHA